MAGDIIPIELGLTNGDFVTLWAPNWREGDDEWEAFLGLDEDLFGFHSVAELVAFVRTNVNNDLVEHPSWTVVAALSAAELEPAEDKKFDIIGVPELAASKPSAEVISELEEILALVASIGEVCELGPITKFFSGNPVLSALAVGPTNFTGRDGRQLWSDIGGAIARNWDKVVDSIDEIMSTPKVDPQAVEIAEDELIAATENEIDIDIDDSVNDDLDLLDDKDVQQTDDDLTSDDVYFDDVTDDDDTDEEETFWTSVGIDPIQIITSAGTFFTLRCYLDDSPIFLGRNGKISVFNSERALSRYLADQHDHDLAEVSTYEEIRTAATDGSLKIDVTEENIYVLTGLADDLADGPTAVDQNQLDLAVELLTDAADFADDDSVDEALAASEPLGWLVKYTLSPDPSKLVPSPPFDAQAQAWRDLERGLEARLRKE
ncbi:MAG: primosomal protein [Mycobacteriaceae bacterium]